MTSRAKYHDGKPTTKQRTRMEEHDRNVFTPTPTMRGRTGIQFISDSALKQAEKEAQLAEKLRQKKIEDRKKRLSVLAERAKSSERPVTTNLGSSNIGKSYSKNLYALPSAPPLVLRSRTEEEQAQKDVRESLGEEEKRHWQATEETYNPAELLRKTRRQNRGGKRKRRKTRKRRRKPKHVEEKK